MLNAQGISRPEESIVPVGIVHDDLQCLLISEIFGALLLCPPLQTTLNAITHAIRTRLGFHSCAILLKQPEEDLLTMEGAAGLSADYITAVNCSYPATIEDPGCSEGPSSQALLTGHAIIIDDIETDTSFRRWKLPARQQGVRSLIALPFSFPRRKLIGTLVCYQRFPRCYQHDEVCFLTKIAAHIGTAVEIAYTVEVQQKTVHQLEKTVEEFQKRARHGFVNDLITGKYDDPQQMQDRGRYLGYDLRGPFQVLVIDFDQPDFTANHPSETEMQALHHRFLDAVRHIMKARELPVLVTSHHNQLVILLPTINELHGKAAERIITIVQHTMRQLSPHVSVSSGLGQSYPHLDQIRTSYQEATRALQVIRRLGGRAKTLAYTNLGVTRLLLQVENAAELIDYARSRLGTVLAYDQQHNGLLLQALEAYLAANQSVPLASKQLDLHPNTLRYRLRKVESLLDSSLNDTALLLDLQLACLILRLIETEHSPLPTV